MSDDISKPAAAAAIKTIKWPSDDEMKVAFEAYALALGKVAFAWNYLHEKLGQLFVLIADCDRQIALGIWYSSDSDRVKQQMLREAIIASHDDRWLPRLLEAKNDLIWLADRVVSLTEDRNNAVHAPCTLMVSETGTDMAANVFSLHDRAQKLRGKQILVEFDWCERWTEELSRFTMKAESALASKVYPWPDRPLKPMRKPRNALGLPHRPQTK